MQKPFHRRLPARGDVRRLLQALPATTQLGTQGYGQGPETELEPPALGVVPTGQ